MCGRFAVTLPPDAMAQLFAAIPANDLPDVPNYNVCPTNAVHVVTADADAGARRLSAMRWGFIPHWYKAPNDGPLLINARAETIADKPAFRSACRTRRAVILASGFYEWTREGDARLPWYITRRDAAPLAFAAIWQDWAPKGSDDTLRTVAIVTTAANAPMLAIHHRMPVILAQKDVALWLGEEGKGAATLMQAAPDDALRWHRVGTEVNTNRASGAQLVDPLEGTTGA